MPPECGRKGSPREAPGKPKGSAREAQEGRGSTKAGGYVVRGSSVGSVGVEAGAGFVCSGGGVDFSGLLGDVCCVVVVVAGIVEDRKLGGGEDMVGRVM